MNMLNKSVLTFSSLAVAAMFITGCANPNTSGDVYKAGDVGTERSIRYGVVQSTRKVTIEKGETGVGVIGGGLIGGIAGSTIGGGTGSAVAAVAGAVVGGLAGQAIERNTAKEEGLEITIKLNSGETIAVVQATSEQFNHGEAVQLVGSGSNVKVTKRQ